MKRFCGLLLVVFFMGMLLVNAQGVLAQDAVALSLRPATLAIAPENEFSITVILNSGQQTVDGAQIALAFDPARLSVLSLTPGVTLPDVFQQSYDNGRGRVLYAAGKMLGELPKGELELFRVQFRAVSAGASLLEFAADSPLSTKVTSGGKNLAIEAAASQVTIISGASIAATPTSTATQNQQATATRQTTAIVQANTPTPTAAGTGYPGPRTPTTAAQATTPTAQFAATQTASPPPSFTATRVPTGTALAAETATPRSTATQMQPPATPSRSPVVIATIPSPTAVVASTTTPSPTVLPSLAAITPLSVPLSGITTPVPRSIAEVESESRRHLVTVLSVLAIIAIAVFVFAFAFVRRRWLTK